ERRWRLGKMAIGDGHAHRGRERYELGHSIANINKPVFTEIHQIIYFTPDPKLFAVVNPCARALVVFSMLSFYPHHQVEVATSRRDNRRPRHCHAESRQSCCDACRLPLDTLTMVGLNGLR